MCNNVKMFTSEIFAKMFSSVSENTHGKKKLVARIKVMIAKYVQLIY